MFKCTRVNMTCVHLQWFTVCLELVCIYLYFQDKIRSYLHFFLNFSILFLFLFLLFLLYPDCICIPIWMYILIYLSSFSLSVSLYHTIHSPNSPTRQATRCTYKQRQRDLNYYREAADKPYGSIVYQEALCIQEVLCHF